MKVDLDKLHQIALGEVIYKGPILKLYDLLASVQLGDKYVFCLCKNYNLIKKIHGEFLDVLKCNRMNPDRITFDSVALGNSYVKFFSEIDFDIKTKGISEYTLVDIRD